MSINFSYDMFITQLNNYKIKRIVFSVKNYPHYNNCSIQVKSDELKNTNVIYSILIRLTNDGSEDVGFYKQFKEEYKLFHMGKKGSFTLKQMWNKIDIMDVEYFDYSNVNI